MSGMLAIPVGDADHAKGDPGAAVTLVEYGDYQCPACGMAYPFVQDILRRNGSKLRFVFRNFPLSQAHPYASMAAQVAEGAATLGRFWEMHDWLYQHQDAWTQRGAEGICLDADGNIVVCAGSNQAGPGSLIYIMSPTGRVLETQIFPDDGPMRCAFGGKGMDELYVTSATGNLWRARQTGRVGLSVGKPGA